MNTANRHIADMLRTGLARHASGDLAGARARYEEILALNPDQFDALHSLGILAAQTGDPLTALRLIGRAIAQDPHQAAPFCNLGNALQALNRLDEAAAQYERAIELRPDYEIAHFNMGKIHLSRRQWDAAVAHYDRAILANPRRAESHFLRGNSLREAGDLQAALAAYDHALRLRPGYAEAHLNRGVTHRLLGNIPEALDCFNQAIAANTGFAEAYVNRAGIQLTLGNYGPGWVDYEWRWRMEGNTNRTRPVAGIRWDGIASLAGKTILLSCEQGLGDTIQFVRFATPLSAAGAKVIVEVQPPLQTLLETVPGVAATIPQGQPAAPVDFHCPLMSVPRLLQVTTSDIPAPPAYVSAKPEKLGEWHSRLGQRRRLLRVGLAWAGGHRPDHPELWSVDSRRNIPLETLLGIAHADAEFFSLQKGEPGESDLRAYNARRGDAAAVIDLAHLLHDFSDTAALMGNLDLVITVDTSVAHLAAALGRPVWILNRYDACWRWLLDRKDSPWYPSARLYRQPGSGDWASVVRSVRADLGQFAIGHRASIQAD